MSNYSEQLAEKLSELVDSGQLALAVSRFEESAESIQKDLKCSEIYATAKRRLALIKKWTTESQVARRVDCPKCKVPLSILSSTSSHLSCYACGSITDLQTLKTIGNLKSLKLDDSAFKIGMQAKLDDCQVQIIGCIEYSARIEEWDPEDSCYTTGTWRWIEFSLLSKDAEVLYLCQDAEGYSISESFIPRNPVLPNSIQDGILISEDGKAAKRFKIQEWGTAKIISCVGEFSWYPDRNSSVEYAEAEGTRLSYGVEWRRDSRGNKAEVEFYKSHKVELEYLLASFGLNKELEILTKRKSLNIELICWSSIFFILSLIFGSFYMMSPDSGRVVYATQLPSLKDVSPDGLELGPFNLNKVGAAHSIHMKASMPDNSDLWVGAELLDQQRGAINAIDKEFWRESGYDDGYYSESDLESGMIFNLSSPGIYFIRLFSEKDPIKPVDGKISLTIREQSLNDRLFILLSVVSGFLSLILGLFVYFRMRIKRL